MVSIVWAIVFLGCMVTLFVLVAFQPMSKNVQTWCEMRKSLSKDKKDIEMRRLDVIEKTPELRQLVFHPKILEKEEK
jgi:hypothetical protein